MDAFLYGSWSALSHFHNKGYVMYFHDGGYLGAEYDPIKLREIVSRLAGAIPFYMEACKADAIVVTGKSGVSVAFAALTAIDFPLIVVRKRGETTHGSPIEGTGGVDVKRYLILDDFVSSGSTVREVVARLDEAAALKGSGPISCVGVLEYAFDMRRETSRVVRPDANIWRGVGVKKYGVKDFSLFHELPEGAQPEE